MELSRKLGKEDDYRRKNKLNKVGNAAYDTQVIETI